MPHACNPPTICPVCGEPVPRQARACPGCGADERSGWDEDATRYDGLDLPEEAFDDESRGSPPGSGKWPLVVTIVLLATLILTFVFN